jgi:tetratricopeptide (TPR) repeat protein
MREVVQKMSNKRIIVKTILSFFLSISFFTLFSNTYAEECNPPLWALKPPQLEGVYFGVGSASFGKDDEETKSTAYQRAVGTLALMAGQTITSSFEEYIKEEKIKGEWAEESKAINTIKNIAQKELRGITIRDFYKDTCEKLYYVLVVIDKKDANAQIRENAERLKETELKDLIDKGISKLEGRIAGVEQKVSGLEEKYGDLLQRLARLEESSKNEKQVEGLAGVGEQVQKIKEDVAAGKSREEIEQALTATEWFEKANNLRKEIEGKEKENISELEQVTSYYSRAIEINPKYANAYNNRGNAYTYKGDYDRAISDFNQAILLNPKNAVAYDNRGFAYYKKGDYDKAISDFNQAILLNPKYDNAYKDRGSAYYKKGDLNRSISDCDQAILLNPKNDEAYNCRGIAYYKKGDYDQAISDYNQAISLNLENAVLYYNRACLYYSIGNKEKALNDLIKSIQIDPSIKNQAKRGECYTKLINLWPD